MNSDIRDIEREWNGAIRTHPFLGRVLTEREKESEWDRVSRSYSGSEYDGTRMMMFADLEDMGVISEDRDMLDIGCGPGLYDIAFSRHLRSVTCVDISGRMIERLRRECRRRGADNVTAVRASWSDYFPDCGRRFGVVHTSLCPDMYSPHALSEMEELAEDWCVYVCAGNRSGGIRSSIWRDLGTDNLGGGMSADYPYSYLTAMGREPVMKSYYRHTVSESDPEDRVREETEYFGRYFDMTPDLRMMIEGRVSESVRGGRVCDDRGCMLHMLVWRP